MSNENVLNFQVITGANEAKANQFLKQANNNLELAISNFFDSGEVVQEMNALALPENQVAPVVPLQKPQEILQEEYIGTLPGLYTKSDQTLVPLKSIDTRVKIINFLADVEVTQRFLNEHDKTIEAVFKFENYNASLSNFEVEVDGKVWNGICKDKESAINDYEDAIASKHGAYLAEQGRKDNVINISVGNLPPKKECRVTIRYISELDIEDDYLKFNLPITRTRIIPPGNSKDDKEALSGLAITMDLQMQSDITEIKCNSHKIDQKIEGGNATVTLRSRQPESGKEFELFIKVAKEHEPVAYVEVFSKEPFKTQEKSSSEEKVELGPQPGGELSLADFGPQPGQNFFQIDGFPQPGGGANAGLVGFESPNQSNEKDEKLKLKDSDHPHAIMLSLFPQLETDDDSICEIIFLIDRSGSMAGSRMNQAKNALQLFLRSLPIGTRFNIVGFGDKMEKFAHNNIVFDNKSLQEATAYISKMQANLGGTDILTPLKSIFQNKADDKYPRQVFCITDGEVRNTKNVLNFVKSEVGLNSRIFTFGIGAEASKELVRGIAKYGRGKAEFVVSGERMEGKVLKQLKRALQPILNDISINWDALPIHHKYANIKQNLPPVFSGERLILYNFIDGTQQFGKRTITISGSTGNQAHKWEIPIDMENNVVYGSHIHRLAARYFINALEAKDAIINKELITELGIQWGLVTKYTSYVAVEERDFDDAAESTDMKLLKINKTINDTLLRGECIDGLISEANEELQSAKKFSKKSSSLSSGFNSIFSSLGSSIKSTIQSASDSISSFVPNLSVNELKEAAPTMDNPLYNSNYNSGGGFKGRKLAEEDIKNIDTEFLSADYENESDNDDEDMADTFESFSYKPELSSLELSPSPKESVQQIQEQFYPPPPRASAPQPQEQFYPPPSFQGQFNQPTQASAPQPQRQYNQPTQASAPQPQSQYYQPTQASALQPQRQYYQPTQASAPQPQSQYYQLPQAHNAPTNSSASFDLYPSNQTILPQVRKSSSIDMEDSPVISNEESEVYEERKSKSKPKSIDRDIKRRLNSSKKSEDKSEKQTNFAKKKETEKKDKGKSRTKSSSMEYSAPQAPLESLPGHSEMRRIDSFILLQSADGFFSLDDAFLKITSLSKDAILNAMPSKLAQANIDSNIKITIWTTVIALVFLEVKFESSKDEWELLSDKSRKIVQKHLTPLQIDLESLKSAAKALF